MRSAKRSTQNSKKRHKVLAITLVTTLCILFILLAGSYIRTIKDKAVKVSEVSSVIGSLLGSNGQSRTLLLFSNNAEMRFGGGFIGSVGYIDAKSPTKVAIDPIHSVYYYDHRIDISDSRLEAAPPELPLMPKVYLRDSGVDLDWTKNAQRAIRLFELESGKKVDNVVMLTPNVVKELLKVTGPIYLSEYGFSVTHDNFLVKVQLEVESGADKRQGKDPKTILGVLANKLIGRVAEKSSPALTDDYLELVEDMLEQKQLAVYSTKPAVQEKIVAMNLDGGLSPAEGNYLMVADTNVGANKSSPFIKQDISQKLMINSQGDAKVEVKIVREHTGDYLHQYFDPHDGKTKWLVGDNIGFVKLAVPKGSKMLNSSQPLSRDPYTESGRTVFTYAAQLKPRQLHSFTIEYELPFRYKFGKELTVSGMLEKPIGSFNQQYSLDIVLPPGYERIQGQLPRGEQASDARYIITYGSL